MSKQSRFKSIVASFIAATSIFGLTACDPVEQFASVVPVVEERRVDDPTIDVATPAFDPVAYVNSLPYSFGNAEVAAEGFIVVARDRGWSEADIVAWTPFAINVMLGESAGCPLLRRGAKFVDANSCALTKQGKHSDSGIAQILMGYPGKAGWYRPTGGGVWKLHEHATWLCPQENLCSPDEVVASPWASYTAFIATLERTGGGAWCYKRSRHQCSLRP